jgi:hypothetical protein
LIENALRMAEEMCKKQKLPYIPVDKEYVKRKGDYLEFPLVYSRGSIRIPTKLTVKINHESGDVILPPPGEIKETERVSLGKFFFTKIPQISEHLADLKKEQIQQRCISTFLLLLNIYYLKNILGKDHQIFDPNTRTCVLKIT